MKSKHSKIIRRDSAIVANFAREINLSTKVVKSKKAYTRKRKHKNSLEF